jgi:DNA modification methylase
MVENNMLGGSTIGKASLVNLYHGECLDMMSRLETGSVDMILCDLPYG